MAKRKQCWLSRQIEGASWGKIASSLQRGTATVQGMPCCGSETTFKAMPLNLLKAVSRIDPTPLEEQSLPRKVQTIRDLPFAAILKRKFESMTCRHLTACGSR